MILKYRDLGLMKTVFKTIYEWGSEHQKSWSRKDYWSRDWDHDLGGRGNFNFGL